MKLRIYSDRKKSGFTIIEVIIVLAVIGILTTIILAGYTQAQASRRDSFRKAYARTVYQSMLDFQRNNRKIPACDDAAYNHVPRLINQSCSSMNSKDDAIRFLTKYMEQGVSDPTALDPYTSSTWHDCSFGVAGTDQMVCTDSTKYFFDSSGVDHSSIPPVGDVYIGTGHWCSSNHPVHPQIDDHPDWPVTSKAVMGVDLDISKFYILIGTERGKYYCLDNYASP